MIDQRRPSDLEDAERPVQRLLSAIPPRALPLGFRDEVMRQVTARTTLTWEWIAAAVLAVPSLAFLIFQVVDRADEVGAALNNIVAAAASDSSDAFFFVDGTVVLALAILGVASLIAAHAALVRPVRRTTVR